MIKRTAKSRSITGDGVLVRLSPHETRKKVCPLSNTQRKKLRDADQTSTDRAKAEQKEPWKVAIIKGQPEPKAS